jgi:GNAT superfamily N-acetyltransferase
MQVVRLARERVGEAAAVLARACAFDAAAAVADEKLFGAAPAGPAEAYAAIDGGELAGIAAVSARWARIIAVVPEARGKGIGSALLATCEQRARANGFTQLVAVAQPGNYLAPGIDERDAGTLAWLERRGFTRGSELRENLIIDVRNNPRVTPERLAEVTHAATARGYELRPANHGDRQLLADAIAAEFGGAWPFEIERALDYGAAHVAIRDGKYCAFAATNGNNQGLGWFGPAGTWPEHRGQGLGEALLLACLLDVAQQRATCEVAWIGPRAFYERVAGIAGTRRFVPMKKSLTCAP